MRHLLWRELRARLRSPLFWLLAAGLWAICAWLLFAQLQVYQQILPRLVAGDVPLGVNALLVSPTLNTLALLLLVAVPVLGMDALAGERRSGRLPLLLASPLSLPRLLLAKWLGIALPAGLLVLLLLLLPASLALGARLQWDRLAVALLMLWALVALLSALVLCCSALTRQPAAALAGALAVGGFLWLMDAFVPADAPWRWLALSPHLDPGLHGTLRAGDLAWFALLGGAFLAFAGIALLRQRERPPLRPLREALALGLVVTVLVLAAPLAQRHDRTLYRSQPVPAGLLEALKNLHGPVTVTAWAPDLPVLRARIEQLLRPLQEQYPNLSLRWIDPQREPRLAREAGVLRLGELHIEAMGRSQQVRSLTPQALQIAFSRLARLGDPWIVALQGHGEADLGEGPAGLGDWVKALEQLGFRVVGLPGGTAIPDNAALVLIAAPQRALPLPDQEAIARYLGGGGRVLWLHEHDSSDNLQTLFGLRPLPGTLISPVQETGLTALQFRVRRGLEPLLEGDAPPVLLMDGAHGLLPEAHGDWRPVARLLGPERAWNETGALDEKARHDPLAGERRGPHLVGLALARGEARAVVLGDSDLARNALIGRAGNRAGLMTLVNWLTGNRLAATQAVDDRQIRWTPETGARLALAQLLGVPLLLVLVGLGIHWWRRRA